MSKLLERAVASAAERMVLLVPDGRLSYGVGHVEADAGLHTQLLHDMQRMRAHAYLADGAIVPSQLTADGRHQTPQDDRAWHILTLDARGQVAGCAWFLEHAPDVTVSDLRVRRCPLTKLVEQAPRR